MKTRYRVGVLVLLAIVVSMAAPALAVNHPVSMTDNAFSPALLTIIQGDQVTWTNNGFTQHTSTSGTPCRASLGWNSGSLNPGGTFQHTFNTTGTFPYFCQIHCLLGMTGTITVNAPPVAVESATWGAIKALYRASNP